MASSTTIEPSSMSDFPHTNAGAPSQQGAGSPHGAAGIAGAPTLWGTGSLHGAAGVGKPVPRSRCQAYLDWDVEGSFSAILTADPGECREVWKCGHTCGH